MKVHVELDGGLLADRFGKYASEPDRLEGFPVRSFPIEISDVPQEARTLALTFIDFDAIPVGGFCWIHWTACNLPATTTLIPEDASRTGAVAMVQGRNSNWSPMAHGSDNPQVHSRYCGPQPPDATHSYTLNVYALDCELGLPEGFYLNELRRAMDGHVLDQASLELPSRAWEGAVHGLYIRFVREILTGMKRILWFGAMRSSAAGGVFYNDGYAIGRLSS